MSIVNWLKEGDRNTKFFHASCIQRRQHNKILRLKNEEGRWLTNQKLIKNEIVSFYKKIFSASQVQHVDAVL